MVAKKIKEYITDMGIKQAAIAKKVGMTDGQLSGILTGRYKLKADDFFKICEAIGVEPEKFNPKNEG